MEKKKYSYEYLFQKIHEKMEDHSNRSEKSNTFNIFKVLGIADKEVLICRLLGDLLDPNGSHGLKEKPLLAFLEQLQVANYFSLDKIKKAYTVLEETVEYDRRVDIVIYIGDSVIPIEVKIWAGDQSRQLYDYYQYYSKTRRQNGTFKIYYLTPNGRNPSEISICDPATNQRLTPDQYQCLSFREDVGDWLERILGDCSPRIETILQQFQEVISEMCSEDTLLQSIQEAIHLQEGHFESNENLEALILILAANKTNELWKRIRKEYLRQNLKFDQSKYQLADASEEEQGHAIFTVKAVSTGKRIAWICVDTNLYIVAKTVKPEYEDQPEWKKEDGYFWQYLSPNGSHSSHKKFNLKDPNPSIVTDSSIEIGDLLEQIPS